MGDPPEVVVSVTTIRVTEEIRRVVAQYRIAVEAHMRATTEAHTLFWEKEMDRHRANLMSIVNGRLGDITIPIPRSGVFFTDPEGNITIAGPTEEVK